MLHDKDIAWFYSETGHLLDNTYPADGGLDKPEVRQLPPESDIREAHYF